MPLVDTAYIIGVFREWEKELLEEGEFTRLIEASSGEEAVHMLVDTPYGKWIDVNGGTESVFHAIERHLHALRAWLTDKVTDERVTQFIAARYDALNIATCLLQKYNKEGEPGTLSILGSIDHSVLYSSIWNDVGWEKMPEYWERAVKEIDSEGKDVAQILNAIADKSVGWMNTLAFTPLTHALVEYEKNKLEESITSRPLKTEQETFEFELRWDEKLMALIKKYRHIPTGFDPILAFWYAKELEGKNIKLLMTAKLAGSKISDIKKLKRSFYLTYA